MAWNGTGTFQRVRNWVADAAAGIKIRADYHDAEDDNLAAGINNCIARDGQSTITNNIPFNNKRITGLADPVNPQDAATMASSVPKTGGGMTGDLVLPANAVSAARFQLWPDITKFSITSDGTSLVLRGGTGAGVYGFNFTNGPQTTGWANLGPSGMVIAGTLAVGGAITSGGVPVVMKADFDALLARIEALESRGT